MPTVGAILEEASRRFELRGISSPRLDAEVLLGWALGLDRARLLAHTDEPVDAGAVERFGLMSGLRESRKPVAYILGRKEFWSMELEVNEDVLVPRPETELVVEKSLELLGAAPSSSPSPILVDVGTGAGPIALALAHEVRSAEIHATDVSAAALEVARRNASSLGPSSRIRFHLGDLLEPILDAGPPGRIDLVVSNPPYVGIGEQVDEEVRLWEPPAAVYGGASGLEVIERLVPQASRALAPGGHLVLEVSRERVAGLREIIEGAGMWEDFQVSDDLAGLPRVATARRARRAA